MSKKWLAALALAFILSLTGCQNTETVENSAPSELSTTTTEKQITDTPVVDNSLPADNSATVPATTNKQNRTVIMLGRSVMNGWFEYWQVGDGVYQKGRFTLEYQALDSPPDIATSVRRIMRDLPAAKKDIIFFKFCFVDFAGGENANANLAENKKYIEEVYKIVAEEHGAKLIIGNALPQVSNDTDIYLVWNHQQYNSWLQDFWKQHPDDITIFNMYDKLSDSLGALNKDYAADVYDSHLNQSGYEKIDQPFWEMMENLY